MMAAYALKYYGGKQTIAWWILSNRPPRGCYDTFADHFCGSAAVAVEMARISQYAGLNCILANDLDPAVVAMLKTICNNCQQFQELLRGIPYSLESFQRAQANEHCGGNIAVNEYVLLRMSRNGDREHFSVCNRIRRGMNEGDSKWLTGIDRLPGYSLYLQMMLITNLCAHTSAQQMDSRKTLHYFDPPYMHVARGSFSDYRYELATNFADDVIAHTKLAETLYALEGCVMLSGYPTELYRNLYESRGWRREDYVTTSAAQSGEKKAKRVESVWMNYNANGGRI